MQTARSESLCDEIVTTLPRLGDTVGEALDGLSEAVAVFVGRVQDFNDYQTTAASRLNTLGAAGEEGAGGFSDTAIRPSTACRSPRFMATDFSWPSCFRRWPTWGRPPTSSPKQRPWHDRGDVPDHSLRGSS